MDRRENALKEALHTNTDETLRWRNYLKDNETAIENLSMFGKRLTVDVMVPVGSKAFMPGNLLHTNEVLVGHYQGYFSKCTSHKAKEICELRIKMAREHLEKLEKESDLWQYKLNIPYTEGVMPSGEEREIVEEFNEEQEQLWKEQHKIQLRKAKLQEKEERDKDLNKKELQPEEKSDEEIMKLLEEAELMEELEQELEKLEVDEVNDETIRKLMSGEMKLPEEKHRLALDKARAEERKLNEIHQAKIVKKNEICNNKMPATNNNNHPNPELLSRYLNSNDIEDIEDEPEPKEVQMIKEQAKFLNAENQIGFYEYQIQIIRQKLLVLPLRTQEELDEKIRLLNVLEHLDELLEVAEETVGAEELLEKDKANEDNETPAENETQPKSEDSSNNPIETNEKKSSLSNDTKTKSTQKRRISFALEDQTLEFRKHETITQMMPPKAEKPQRDIITLDDQEIIATPIVTPTKTIDKKDSIQAKVERNLQYVSENQSKQDFDLVQQILETSKINTLQIKFKHSKQEAIAKDNKDSSNIPQSPADIYDLYIKSQESSAQREPSTLFINSYDGEDQVKVPALKEADRQEAFHNPKSEFSNPAVQAKSILRNKSAVDKENHQNDEQQENINKNKKSKKKSKPKQEDEEFSAYNKVMNDVVEKPAALTEPEPLPDVKFIDAHTPKKRISRFKQMRQGSEKT